MNALKHGLFARKLEASIHRLKEDPAEFRAFGELVERHFVPADEIERNLVRLIGEAVWRRLRLFRAQALSRPASLPYGTGPAGPGQACWETQRLKALLADRAGPEKLTPEETRERATLLMKALAGPAPDNMVQGPQPRPAGRDGAEPLNRQTRRIESEIEGHLRQLLLHRSAGAMVFKFVSPRRERVLTVLDRLSHEALRERLESLSFERLDQVHRQLRARARRKATP